MALMPTDVKLPPDLSSIFSGIGTGAYNQMGQNYNQAQRKATFDPSMGGPGTGTTGYQQQRLGAQQGLDIGNLEAGLGGDLGNTAYKNTLAERDYQQQRQLADIIGSAARPDTLQEVMAGIGGGARAAGELAPFYSMMTKPSFSMGKQTFPQGQPQMNMPFTYPAYQNNPYLNPGGF